MASLQIVQAFHDKPKYLLVAVLIATVLCLVFLYYDYFLFFQPEFIFYLQPGEEWLLALDLILSALSGLTISLSVYRLQFRTAKTVPSGKIGLAGILVALFAGACPCYYLIPVLAASAGAGSVLLTLSVFFNTHEFEIKLLSLAILVFVAFTLERSLRASCEIKVTVEEQRPKTENSSGASLSKQGAK